MGLGAERAVSGGPVTPAVNTGGARRREAAERAPGLPPPRLSPGWAQGAGGQQGSRPESCPMTTLGFPGSRSALGGQTVPGSGVLGKTDIGQVAALS